MKLSKEYLLNELTKKSPKELATEIVNRQIVLGGIPEGYDVQFDATVQKYTTMLENLVLTEARLA
jgi:hypothetical protein